MQNANAATLLTFDLDTVTPGRRRQEWVEVLDDYFYPIDCALPEDFRAGRVSARDVGAIRVGRIDSDPMLVQRTVRHVGRKAADFYFLPIPIRGRLWLDQHGRRTALSSRCAAFVSTVDPYCYDQFEALDTHALRIAGGALRDRLPDPEDFVSRPLDGDTSPMARVFLSFARSFCDTRDALSDAEAETLARHLLDLLALTLAGADPGSSESAIAAAHRRRVVQHIERHFRDPQLSVAAIATAVGMSERYLQKIFAGRERTVSALLRARRMAEAQRLLEARRDTVSSVAYKVGFMDPAHFSRVFRRETGMAPQEYARN